MQIGFIWLFQSWNQIVLFGYSLKYLNWNSSFHHARVEKGDIGSKFTAKKLTVRVWGYRGDWRSEKKVHVVGPTIRNQPATSTKPIFNHPSNNRNPQSSSTWSTWSASSASSSPTLNQLTNLRVQMPVAMIVGPMHHLPSWSGSKNRLVGLLGMSACYQVQILVGL